VGEELSEAGADRRAVVDAVLRAYAGAPASPEAGAAVRLLQESGETTIAELTGDGIGEVRAMLRHAPKTEKRTARNGSHALGGGGGADPTTSPGDAAAGNPDAGSA